MKKKATGGKIKVTFLIPIYNAREFLTQCLESLRRQTLAEAEFLCLNDGSTDDSLAIIKEFVASDPRFRVITKKNTGYGDTMNLGLDEAQGEFVGIVESDDWIEPEMAELLYNKAKLHQADIAKSDYFTNKRDFDWRQQLLPVNSEQPNLSAAQIEHLLARPATIWTALYRRRFLDDNKLRFLGLLDHRFQDSSFAFKTLACAHRVYYTNQAFYHYRLHAGQSVVSRSYPTSILREYEETERFLRERGILQDFAAALTLAKFYGYKWNTARLPWTLSRKFVTLAKSDWKHMQEAGIYDTRLFDGKEQVDMWLARFFPEGYIAKAKVNLWRQRG